MWRHTVVTVHFFFHSPPHHKTLIKRAPGVGGGGRRQRRSCWHFVVPDADAGIDIVAGAGAGAARIHGPSPAIPGRAGRGHCC